MVLKSDIILNVFSYQSLGDYIIDVESLYLCETE